MMAEGSIVLDVSGTEREGLTVNDLLERFRSGAGHALDNDRILLAEGRGFDLSAGTSMGRVSDG